MKTITLEKEELLDLLSLVSSVAGAVQYKACHNPALDTEWHKWRTIRNELAKAAGFESFFDPERIKHISVEIK